MFMYRRTRQGSRGRPPPKKIKIITKEIRTNAIIEKFKTYNYIGGVWWWWWCVVVVVCGGAWWCVVVVCGGGGVW
jgi:hypothetical protein